MVARERGVLLSVVVVLVLCHREGETAVLEVVVRHVCCVAPRERGVAMPRLAVRVRQVGVGRWVMVVERRYRLLLKEGSMVLLVVELAGTHSGQRPERPLVSVAQGGSE